MKTLITLALVLPVYNEESCISSVILSWQRVLASLQIDYFIFVINDGSTDNTENILKTFSGNQRVSVINKPNSGHGPTILMAYRQAVQNALWVFQCDSDNEMKADCFPRLWQYRDQFDALFGVRTGRQQNMARAWISACSRFVVRTFFAPGIKDVNTPYRLVRSSVLKQCIHEIPPKTFAPNVIISGLLVANKARIFEIPIPHENRLTGSISLVKWKLWAAAFRAFFQIVTFRYRTRPL